MSYKPSIIIDSLHNIYRLKEPLAEPDCYLETSIGKCRFYDGTIVWYQSTDKYLTNSVIILDEKREASGKASLSRKTNTILLVKYYPQLDPSLECDDDASNYYQNLIGILRWSVVLGRIEICVQVSDMSRYLEDPRTGHL